MEHSTLDEIRPLAVPLGRAQVGCLARGVLVAADEVEGAASYAEAVAVGVVVDASPAEDQVSEHWALVGQGIQPLADLHHCCPCLVVGFGLQPVNLYCLGVP